jgi:hypothetical protein
MGTPELAAIYLVKITKSVSVPFQPFAACGGRMAERANQKLQALAALWEERRPGDRLPARADLPVSVLRPWLGNLALFELRHRTGPVFRLCGTALHARFGGEMTGKPITDLEPEEAEPLRKELESAAAGRKPRRSRHVSEVGQRPQVFHELYLPLAGSSEEAELVLFASYGEGKA